MNRLLGSTTAISIALMNVQPWPLMAQTLTDVGTVVAADGTVLCQPSADLVCDPNDADLIAQSAAIDARLAKEAKAQAKAEAKAQAKAEAKAQAKADAKAADAEAKAQAKADAKAADAEAQAQAKADAKAADAEAKAQAKADAKAADAEAKAQAKADAKAADAEAKAQAKADAKAADTEAKAQAKADAKAQAKADAKAADAEAKTQAKAEAKAQAKAAAKAKAKARAKAKAELGVEPDGTITDPSAGLKTAKETLDPAAPLVDVRKISKQEMETLSDLLSRTENTKTDRQDTTLPLASKQRGRKSTDASPSTEAVTTTTEVVSEKKTRRATQEFGAAPQVVEPGKKDRLSDLERAGLFVLGALVVGTILNQGRQADAVEQQPQQVVSNTGDRVVVLKPDGTYQVYKDDDALLHRPGNTVRTETYRDSSSRTIVDRPDGSQVVTIRDATGRVLRRVHYDNRGYERVLIDDLEPERVIDLSTLPNTRNRPIVISPRDRGVALKVAMADRQIKKIGRNFSLRQVRDIPQVRHLAALIDVDSITFTSGSSALSATEVNALADLGAVMQDILEANPNEVFLIEGHTDAVGKAAMNLALSDRRAETVALALTEYFDIPPENMVVQGYGETELLIDTQADEELNRRVEVRIITPLL